MSKSKKSKAKSAFQSDNREAMRRRWRKAILFNEKERSLIDQYCRKYSIKNKSAFMRNIIVSHILEQLDSNYPKLF